MISLKTDAHLLQIGIYAFPIYQKDHIFSLLMNYATLKIIQQSCLKCFTVTHKSRHVKSKINRSDVWPLRVNWEIPSENPET